jgi:hypothetical protein
MRSALSKSGWTVSAGRLNRDHRRYEPGRIVMEMRIVVGDRATASELAERLTVVFGGKRISHGADYTEVDVQVDRESDRSLIQVLEAVERWLDQARVGSAEMWLGDHSYRVARWVPVEVWQ